jgi:CO/xanthine dehydrogenase Mo-binding subunit
MYVMLRNARFDAGTVINQQAIEGQLEGGITGELAMG